MRIVLVSGIFPPDIGGPARYIPAIAEEFKTRGHSVQVVCLADNPVLHPPEKFPFPVTRIRRGLPLWLRVPLTILKLVKLARKTEIVYANGLNFEVWIAALLTGKPVVHKIVGDYAWERARNKRLFAGTIDEFQTASKSWLLTFMVFARTAPLRSADAVLVPSRYLGRIVTGWGIRRDHVHVVYNAIRPSARPREVNRAPMIATVCRLMPWKGVDEIIAILPRFPHLTLEIAGDGPLRERLEMLASGHGVAERVIFHGNVTEEKVSEILARASAFVLNSTYEGLPHVVLEAMREETPVIATDVGGTSEVVKHEITGLLIKPGSPDDLSAALARVLGDKALSASLVAGANHLLETEFSYARMIAGAESLLHSVRRSR